MQAGEAQERVPDAATIPSLAGRVGVWLTFAGSAYLNLYAEHLRPLSLRPGWVIALAIIDQNPGITQSELGRRLRIGRASSMSLATMLEGTGLVSREALSGRKQTALRLTGSGRDKFQAACAIEDELHRLIVGELETVEQAELLKVLMAIAKKASRARGPISQA